MESYNIKQINKMLSTAWRKKKTHTLTLYKYFRNILITLIKEANPYCHVKYSVIMISIQ